MKSSKRYENLLFSMIKEKLRHFIRLKFIIDYFNNIFFIMKKIENKFENFFFIKYTNNRKIDRLRQHFIYFKILIKIII